MEEFAVYVTQHSYIIVEYVVHETARIHADFNLVNRIIFISWNYFDLFYLLFFPENSLNKL